MFGQTNVEEKNGQPLATTPDMDGRFYQTVTAVPAIVLEDSPRSADVKRSKSQPHSVNDLCAARPVVITRSVVTINPATVLRS